MLGSIVAEHGAVAVFGGGCFWCVEAIFRELAGVTAVKSGYAGGQVRNPTYRQVCTGTTGHAEVVRVTYDPARISYADLLRVFFNIHDPTTPNRQGNDVGTQYRSVVMPRNDTEAATARTVIAALAVAKSFDAPIVTEIAPLSEFWPAEDEHDNYFNRNPWSGYCQAVVAPKLRKFRNCFADRLNEKVAA